MVSILTSISLPTKSWKDSMFKSLISVVLYNLVLPAILIVFAVLWLYLFPEYWWELMLISIIAIFWFYPFITEKFEKFK